jgi:uncharacterized protein (DUF1330 family)
MSYYAVVSHAVDEPDRYNSEYIPGSVALIHKHGGEVLVAGHADVLEGEPAPVIVVMKFPHKGAFDDFYNDPDYQSLKYVRYSLTSNRFMVGSPSADFA